MGLRMMQNFVLLSVILLTGLKPVKKNAPKKTVQNGLKRAKTRKKTFSSDQID